MLTPCLGCEERNMGCHSECGRYKDWLAVLANAKQAETAAKKLESDMAGVKLNGMKRRNRQIIER